jgi:plasmid stabilization system protein ParE
VRDYVIAYAAEEKPLTIVAILHGRRNPRVIAAILRNRT